MLLSRDVRSVAIPRLDPDGHGIHLAWSGPDLLPLSLDGYEVRRRTFERSKTRRVCVELPLSFDIRDRSAIAA